MTTAKIKDSFLKGGKLAIKRLLEHKRSQNAYVVVSVDGKVVRIQVSDLKS